MPSSEPDLIVDGMPASHPGFNRVNRPIAFDGKGNLFVALDGSANLCTEQTQPPPGRPLPSTPPVGMKPCPDLATRAGVWRFDANKVGQKFPAAGEQWATGIRDIDSLDWSPVDGHLYGIMHGRDNTNRLWPDLVSADDDFHIADEMHRITKLTDFGWPYTYYDGVRNARLISPEYGGDGKKSPAPGAYSTPVLTFHSRRSAPVDLLFYSGNGVPPRVSRRSVRRAPRHAEQVRLQRRLRAVRSQRQARRADGVRRRVRRVRSARRPLPARRNIDRLALLKVPTERCTWRIRRRAASGGSLVLRIVGLGQPDLGRSEEHAYETNRDGWSFRRSPCLLVADCQAAETPERRIQVSATGQMDRGPGAGVNGSKHHYMFEIYGLDTMLDVQPSANAFETRANVTKAIQGHVLGKAVYGGLFRRAQ